MTSERIAYLPLTNAFPQNEREVPDKELVQADKMVVRYRGVEQHEDEKTDKEDGQDEDQMRSLTHIDLLEHPTQHLPALESDSTKPEKVDSVGEPTLSTPKSEKFLGNISETMNEAKSVTPDPTEADLFPLKDDPLARVITVRSILVGMIEGALGGAITQLFLFKPVHLHIQPLFLQITCMLLGRTFALIPGAKWWNPGPFGLKETVFSAIVATSASAGALAIEMIVTQALFFDRGTTLPITIMILLSSQIIGYGWAGLLQPILVYPAKMIYPHVLPSAALFYSMFGKGQETEDQISFFKKVFGLISIYEFFPTYIMPALQGLSLFCLTLPKSPLLTNIFGGVQPQEGLGFLQLSMDWSFIGSGGPLFIPLRSQLHVLAGLVIGLFLFPLAYSNSWFSGGIANNFPFLSVSLLNADGTMYPIKQVINSDGTPNKAAVEKLGLPFFTASHVLAQMFILIAVISAISHVFIHEWDIIRTAALGTGRSDELDPHRLIVQKSYRDFPKLGYLALAVPAIALALVASVLDESKISIPGLLLAIGISGLFILAVSFLSAVAGARLALSGVVPMIGGLIFPGNVFGNMWFSTYGASTVAQSVNMIYDLKLGQYMHMPPITVVMAQLLGTVVGLLINIPLMRSILTHEMNVLRVPGGDGVFSGVVFQIAEAQAVGWGAFSSELFLAGKRYFIIPISLVIGILLPVPFFYADKFFPGRNLDIVNMPLVANSIAMASQGVTAGHTGKVIVGLASQFWARKYHLRWFMKYNYVLSAALDGGTQVTLFLIAVIFQGAVGPKVEFPTYFLNPKIPTPRDYCFLTTSRRPKS